MDVVESQLKMELRRPISWINWTALLAAKDSRITTDEGVGILVDKAASTSPLELRIITPIRPLVNPQIWRHRSLFSLVLDRGASTLDSWAAVAPKGWAGTFGIL